MINTPPLFFQFLAFIFQCHFELTREMFELWLAEDPDLNVMDSPAVRADYEAIKEEYEKVGKRLFENWLGMVG